MRSKDLRRYFSDFTENGKFSCFHYRHRPEVQQVQPPIFPALSVLGASNKGVGVWGSLVSSCYIDSYFTTSLFLYFRTKVVGRNRQKAPIPSLPQELADSELVRALLISYRTWGPSREHWLNRGLTVATKFSFFFRKNQSRCSFRI